MHLVRTERITGLKKVLVTANIWELERGGKRVTKKETEGMHGRPLSVGTLSLRKWGVNTERNMQSWSGKNRQKTEGAKNRRGTLTVYGAGTVFRKIGRPTKKKPRRRKTADLNLQNGKRRNLGLKDQGSRTKWRSKKNSHDLEGRKKQERTL